MANPLLIGSAVKLANGLIDRLFPDKEARDRAKLELFRMEQEGELAALAADERLAAGQLEVNKVEAAHRSNFVAGWRPSVGWISAAGLAYQFVLQPFLTWGALMNDYPVPPDLDTTALMTLLMGMLGLGGFRTYEKLKGASR